MLAKEFEEKQNMLLKEKQNELDQLKNEIKVVNNQVKEVQDLLAGPGAKRSLVGKCAGRAGAKLGIALARGSPRYPGPALRAARPPGEAAGPHPRRACRRRRFWRRWRRPREHGRLWHAPAFAR